MTHGDTQHPKNTEQLLTEVEALEVWFAKIAKQYPEPTCRVIDRLKMRTGVAVNEYHMRGAVSDQAETDAVDIQPPSAQTLAAVKDSIRRELAQATVKRRVGWRSHYTGALMTLATAAAIAIVILPGLWKSQPVGNEESVSRFDDWAYVLSVSAESDLDGELAGFEADIDDLSDAIVFSDDELDESELDDIEDAIDQLFSDSDASLDT